MPPVHRGAGSASCRRTIRTGRAGVILLLGYVRPEPPVIADCEAYEQDWSKPLEWLPYVPNRQCGLTSGPRPGRNDEDNPKVRAAG